MSYRVEMSERAEADLDRHLTGLSKISPEAAERLARAFWRALARVRMHPFGCGLAHESPGFTEELRHLLFWAKSRRKYRALFVVRGDVAHVLCIRGPGERPVKPQDLSD
jgi:hypothetical protein